VQHIGKLVPLDVETSADVDAGAVYGEIGPTDTVKLGGATFTFEGTGEAVCVWVDPETVYWTQSISPTSPNARYVYPDNVYDDGDIDLFAGLSVFYSGSPGEELGSFVQEVEDDLGHTITTSLSICNIVGFQSEPDGHAGRGTPEYCTIHNTLPGVSYTVVMQAYSLPLDDDRLGYGLVFANGTCDSLLQTSGASDNQLREECLVMGESVTPGEPSGEAAAAAELSPPTWLGVDEVPSWAGSVAFEEQFCTNGDGLATFCEEHEGPENAEGTDCDWIGDGAEGTDRCYCGNPADTPTGGAF
jgi:hypothetical protein